MIVLILLLLISPIEVREGDTGFGIDRTPRENTRVIKVIKRVIQKKTIGSGIGIK